MKINHINLTVNNVEAARHFLEKYFGLVSIAGTKNEDTFIGMHDEDGFTLTLMEVKKESQVSYPKTFHIGFLNQGKEKTNELYQQLKQDGFDVKPPGHYRENEFYFYTPFGFTIQVS